MQDAMGQDELIVVVRLSIHFCANYFLDWDRT